MASSAGSRQAGPVIPAPSSVPVLRIGIVNNMPDAAFHDTNRQLVALLRQAAGALPLDIAGYLLPDVPRHPSTVATASLPTHPFEALAEAPPHALIVTGLAPGCTQISAEPFWPQLSGLVRWAADHVPSTLLSCLAAHAAAVALHGIARVRLPAKASGVFPHAVLRAHPLARHLGPTVAFPHSRFNGVPAPALAARGYEIVVGSGDDWSVACRRRHGRELVLLQGHPEYAPSTLLREYRRDVAEHLRGDGGGYPGLPEGYLDAEGERCLAELRAR
ncbi:MAG TPA: homoserine O-succinyltransferase, partial [Acidimicrobiales bacterium]|nr:homoserine O-succinyltransferase [Acidimicrobiales bacterium]